MAFKKQREEQKRGAPEYMNTYGDMITLMLTFFVLLYAMSNLDVQKFEQLVSSYSGKPIAVQGGLGNILAGQGPSIINNMSPLVEDKSDIEADDTTDSHAMNVDPSEVEALAEMREIEEAMSQMESNFKTYLSSSVSTSVVSVENLGEYLLFKFPGSLLFDSGKAELRPDGITVLDGVLSELLKYPGHEIRVEGHTDNVPQVNYPYPSNFHLSSARASTVLVYMVDILGFDRMTVTAEGKGENFPVGDNSTAEGRAVNRRVEIKVMARQTGAAAAQPQQYPWDQK